jgi:shikimate kinase
MTVRRGVRPNVALTGFSTTGKSTVGRLLAAELGWTYVDTDALIVERAGRPIHAIFSGDGEAAFRGLESEALAEAVAGEHSVIATGGGAILAPANREILRARAWIVCLTAAPTTVLARLRVAAVTEPRPLLAGDDPLARIETLMTARATAYADADLVVPTDAATPGEVTAAILAWLNGDAADRAMGEVQR